MPHTIVTNVCEGVADCVDACPVACIHEGPGKNKKRTDWYWIDFKDQYDSRLALVQAFTDKEVATEDPVFLTYNWELNEQTEAKSKLLK